MEDDEGDLRAAREAMANDKKRIPHEEILAGLDGFNDAPFLVRDEPRYQRAGGEVWHLDGVEWSDAPRPRRLMHRHWAQTVGWIGSDLIRRCPCGAVSMRPGLWFDAFSR